MFATNSKCVRNTQVYDFKALLVIIAIINSYTVYLTLLSPKLNPELHWMAIVTLLINGSFFLVQLATISPLGFSLREVYYLFMVIFILRGDLLSSLSYTLGFSIPVFTEVLLENILSSKLLGRRVVTWGKNAY